MKTFILLLFVTYVYGQDQDLCGTAPATGFRFANDHSACRAYLWCDFAADGTLASVRQNECAAGFNFDEANQACNAGLACTDMCELNTGTTLVADPADTTCRNFFECVDTVPSTEVQSCPPPSVFNRNFGTCLPERTAPCGTNTGGGGGSVACSGDTVFINNPASCSAYFRCNAAGDPIPRECPTPFHFNPDALFCDDAANLDPLCTTGTISSQAGPDIPEPPHINGHVAMKRRIMSRKFNL